VFILAGFTIAKSFFRAQTSDPLIVQYGAEYLSIVYIFSFGVFNQITFERLLISTGKTVYSMISQGVGAIVNIILDPIMIFGLLGCPAMGVAGAAAATVIGQTIAAGIAFYFNLRRNHDISISFIRFKPSAAIAKMIYHVGVPSVLMMSIGSVMTYGFNRILLPFTATAVAVFGIYFKLQSFIIMPVLGLNNGMVPIVAYNYGAKSKERIITTVKLSMVYAVSIMALGFVLFQIFPKRLLSLFNASAEMLVIGVPALRIISLSFLLAGFCIIFTSVFQALGNGMYSLIVSIARQLLVLLPVAWLLSLGGLVQAVWWAFPIAECASLVISIVLIKRLYDKKIKYLGPRAPFLNTTR
jgi:putative MATE family efflux protein